MLLTLTLHSECKDIGGGLCPSISQKDCQDEAVKDVCPKSCGTCGGKYCNLIDLGIELKDYKC